MNLFDPLGVVTFSKYAYLKVPLGDVKLWPILAPICDYGAVSCFACLAMQVADADRDSPEEEEWGLPINAPLSEGAHGACMALVWGLLKPAWGLRRDHM